MKPLQWVCVLIARRMHAADGSYPYPRLAKWIRRRAGGILLCRYCGYLGWTVETYGRVTHKHACPYRTATYCQSHSEVCDEMGG